MKFGLTDKTIYKLSQVFVKYPEIEKVLIYGSRAKGTFRPGSDIDLTLIGEKLDKSILFHIINEIDDLLLPYQIDLSILHQVSNPDFLGHVRRVGIVFFDRETNKISA